MRATHGVCVCVLAVASLVWMHTRVGDALLKAKTTWGAAVFDAGVCGYTVSLTTVPPRFLVLDLLISRLNALDARVRPVEVIVTVSETYRRFGRVSAEQLGWLRQRGVRLIVTDDHGPVDKVRGVLEAHTDVTLVVDDERYLHDGVFYATCTHAQTIQQVQLRHAGNIPWPSFSRSQNFMGSHGYVLHKVPHILHEVLNHTAQANSVFGVFEDDLWISCIVQKRHRIPVVRMHVDASSFVLSEISTSRTAGLISSFGGDRDQMDWETRYFAFEAGNCSAPPLAASARPP